MFCTEYGKKKNRSLPFKKTFSLSLGELRKLNRERSIFLWGEITRMPTGRWGTRFMLGIFHGKFGLKRVMGRRIWELGGTTLLHSL